MTDRRHCNQPGCDRTHYAHGLCRRHYGRWYNGHAPEPRHAPITPRTRITYTRGGKPV